jgi:hypothetical protein
MSAPIEPQKIREVLDFYGEAPPEPKDLPFITGDFVTQENGGFKILYYPPPPGSSVPLLSNIQTINSGNGWITVSTSEFEKLELEKKSREELRTLYIKVKKLY